MMSLGRILFGSSTFAAKLISEINTAKLVHIRQIMFVCILFYLIVVPLQERAII